MHVCKIKNPLKSKDRALPWFDHYQKGNNQQELQDMKSPKDLCIMIAKDNLLKMKTRHNLE